MTDNAINSSTVIKEIVTKVSENVISEPTFLIPSPSKKIEHEIKFNNVTMVDFHNLDKNLTKLDSYTTNIVYYLNIGAERNLQNEGKRITLTGKDNIINNFYANKGDISDRKVILKKHRKDFTFPELHLKYNISTEEDLPNEPSDMTIAKDAGTSFRYIHRKTFNAGNFYVDLSIVKSSNISFIDAINSKETYEVEIEIVNNDHYKEDDLKELLNVVLKCYQNTNYIMTVSEKQKCLDYLNKQLNVRLIEQNMPISIRNINEISVRNKDQFFITEKTDGEHCYLLILNNRVYLCFFKKSTDKTLTFKNMSIIGTTITNQSNKNYLIEGEYKLNNPWQYGEKLSISFIPFDCITFADEDVKTAKFSERMIKIRESEEFNKLFSSSKVSINQDPDTEIKIIHKDFYSSGKVQNKVLNNSGTEHNGPFTDKIKSVYGMAIETSKDAVEGLVLINDVPYKKSYIVKLKAYDRATVDLAVQKVHNVFANDTSVKYKLFTILTQTRQTKDQRKSYKETKLIPVTIDGKEQFYIQQGSQRQEGQQGQQGQQKQDIIYNNGIYEFLYEEKELGKYEWVLVKHRIDKYIPNAKKTVDTTIDIVRAKLTIDKICAGSYYTEAIENKELVEHTKTIRNINNAVKGHLYASLSPSPDMNKTKTLFEIGFGRFGDAHNWLSAGFNIQNIYGTDPGQSPAKIKTDSRQLNIKLENFDTKTFNDYTFTKQYDVISAQFCLHYFLIDQSYDAIFAKIRGALKQDGHFICTVLDGTRIFAGSATDVNSGITYKVDYDASDDAPEESKDASEESKDASKDDSKEALEEAIYTWQFTKSSQDEMSVIIPSKYVIQSNEKKMTEPIVYVDAFSKALLKYFNIKSEAYFDEVITVVDGKVTSIGKGLKNIPNLKEVPLRNPLPLKESDRKYESFCKYYVASVKAL